MTSPDVLRNFKRELARLDGLLNRSERATAANWLARGELPRIVVFLIKFPSLFAAAYADYYSERVDG